MALTVKQAEEELKERELTARQSESDFKVKQIDTEIEQLLERLKTLKHERKLLRVERKIDDAIADGHNPGRAVGIVIYFHGDDERFLDMAVQHTLIERYSDWELTFNPSYTAGEMDFTELVIRRGAQNADD